jgi:hypothetical protein
MNASAAPPADQGPVAGAVNAVAQAATGAVNAVAQAASAAVNAVIPGANKPANNKKNNAFTFNSLIPLGNATPPPANTNKANNTANTGFNLFGSATKPANNKPANNKPAEAPFNLFGSATKSANNKPANNKPASAVGVESAPPTFANFSVSKLAESPWALPLGIFVGLIILFLIAFSVFNKQIKQGYEYVTRSFQDSVGLNSQPAVTAPIIPAQGTIKEITVPPVAPQTITPNQHAISHQSIVEKILPSGGSAEVYNVAQNKFTFYDAEPLCKALGAELATYEQVKDAWSKGADWCNYGWVKGQMAIYPTQKDTYDKLQAGPADQKGACGTTGINGGYFDNPDMLYGVNCYGKKPAQSAHDEAQLMDEGKIPKSPETLKVDQMMNDFKAQADSLFVKPFSDAKWSTK